MLASSLFVPVALAQAPLTTLREQERQIDSERAALGIDLSTFFGKAKGAGYTLLQPTLMGAARYAEGVLEVALPLAYVHEDRADAEDGNRVALGNPWIALAYLPDCSCGLSRLSLGLAIDATTSHSRLARQASALSRGALGDWDGYLWIDHMLPLVAGVSTRMELTRKLRLSWDGDVMFGLPAGAREFEIGTQHAAELAFVPSWHWQLATRLSGVWYPSLAGDDFQASLGFSLRYVIVGDAVGARFVMNLDRPHGSAFTRDGMWGLGLFYSTALGR